MFKSILIANRGEIACRVIRTARRLGIRCVAVYSEADRNSRHVAEADEAICIGPAPATQSYLRIGAIIAAARRAQADAIHPGYGFLSEKAEFAEACEAAGVVFIGPPATAIRAMGLKDAAKKLMQKAGVPVVPGYHGGSTDIALLAKEASEIGFPILVKASAGGGGKGMRRVDDAGGLGAALTAASREAASSFGDGSILLEKFIPLARHIEIQIFADAHGNAVSLFERDCSLQRRHQKIIEEAPAPGVTPAMRDEMGRLAVQAARAIGYHGAGTVEFIADVSNGLRADAVYFLEMNTRLQVEHPITEAITGLDLVEWQLRVAAGEPLPLRQEQLTLTGHAFEARICAEDTARNFLPATGILTHLHFPTGVRIDSGVRQGDTITPYYDPLIAKLIVHGADRPAALAQLSAALSDCRAVGCATNIAFLKSLIGHEDVAAGRVDTGLVEREAEILNKTAEPASNVVAVAALASLGFLSPPPGADPWRSLRGFRAWGDNRCHFALTNGGQLIEGYASPRGTHDCKIELPDSVLDCRWNERDEGQLHFEAGTRTFPASVVFSRSEIVVFADGQRHAFQIPRQTTASAGRTNTTGSVVSPITGLVRAVNAGLGERVAKGAALLVIEAMKLEHTITAPRDGIVAGLNVKEGDQVGEGSELLHIAQAPESSGAPDGN